MKKAFDQTVRDLKREVNKKVLKVPSIEQKVLDATSNETWGPHGSLLADIAQATRNYHEYQMIMSVIWKRINDTGKNWRHVYKALFILDYLVANGSERVIDDIREHAYQISTLSDFQYIDSSGRDQGNNVRKKSQSLVFLVNDKERIQEARDKAAANRDKFRSTAGNTYRSNSGYGDRYDDDHYEGRYRDDDRNGNGRERDWGSNDRYGKYGDSYGREGDRYARDAEDRFGRESYHDDDYRGRSQSVDNYHHGSRGRSADSSRNANADDGQYSSRGSNVKADDHSQDGSNIDKKVDHKYSVQSTGAPPSYEDAVGSAQSPTYSDRDVDSSAVSVPKPLSADPNHGVASATSPVALGNSPGPVSTLTSPPALTHPSAQPASVSNDDDVDEFDPRSLPSAGPALSNGSPAAPSSFEMDLLGSLEGFSTNSLSLVPTSQSTAPEIEAQANGTSGTTVSASKPSSTVDQSFDDPFGDGPFKALPSADSLSTQQNASLSFVSFNAIPNQVQDASTISQGAPTGIAGLSYDAAYVHSSTVPPPTTPFAQQEVASPIQEVDILADILPPTSAAPAATQVAYPTSTQPISQGGFNPEANQPVPQSVLSPLMLQTIPQNGSGPSGGFPPQLGQPSMHTTHALVSAQPVLNTGFANQPMGHTYPVHPQSVFSQGVASQTSPFGFPTQAGSLQPSFPNPNVYSTYNPRPLSTGQTAGYGAPAASSAGPAILNNFTAQAGSGIPQSQPQPVTTSNPSLMGSSAVSTQPSEDNFKTKSTIWADTLSRGLVNLNISGPKANPLADIGVDFDSINRKEKRMEKPSTNPVTSTVTMGRAMGTGSGIGRAAAGALRPPSNPLVGSSMNMGMGLGGGYGACQPMGRGMPMNIPGNMGIGPGMGMQHPMGFPPGTAMPGNGLNIGGPGNYAQPPYGGGYR